MSLIPSWQSHVGLCKQAGLARDHIDFRVRGSCHHVGQQESHMVSQGWGCGPALMKGGARCYVSGI